MRSGLALHELVLSTMLGQLYLSQFLQLLRLQCILDNVLQSVTVYDDPTKLVHRVVISTYESPVQ